MCQLLKSQAYKTGARASGREPWWRLVHVHNSHVLDFGGNPLDVGIILALTGGYPGDVFCEECHHTIIYKRCGQLASTWGGLGWCPRGSPGV